MKICVIHYKQGLHRKCYPLLFLNMVTGMRHFIRLSANSSCGTSPCWNKNTSINHHGVYKANKLCIFSLTAKHGQTPARRGQWSLVWRFDNTERTWALEPLQRLLAGSRVESFSPVPLRGCGERKHTFLEICCLN